MIGISSSPLKSSQFAVKHNRQAKGIHHLTVFYHSNQLFKPVAELIKTMLTLTMARRRFRDPLMTCIKIDKSLPASIALLDTAPLFSHLNLQVPPYLC